LTNFSKEDEVRDSQFHVRESTTAILGSDALRNQKENLKNTLKTVDQQAVEHQFLPSSHAAKYPIIFRRIPNLQN
jgi:hypothetical protein